MKFNKKVLTFIEKFCMIVFSGGADLGGYSGSNYYVYFPVELPRRVDVEDSYFTG